MGKKGKWLTSVKNAFRSPIKDGDDEELEAKDLDLFGDIRPLGDKQERPKQKVRRWSFGKLAPSEDKEPEKKRDRETILSDSKFAMYMYPSQEEWAAVVIQTAVRGYLARRSLRALRGLVRLQAFVRGHRVRRQANTTMQAVAHVQGRIRTSEEGLAVQHQMWQRGQPVSRKASCQDGVTEAGWNDSNLSAKQIEAKVQERQVAALKRERTLAYARTQQQLKKASPKPIEVEKARPWESRIFENHSAFKDVADDHVSKSLDTSVKSPPVVKGHLQATQSVKNKARSASQPRTRPGAGAFKTPATMKRLSYAKSEQPAQKAVVGRPKSGVLPGPHQYRDM